MATMSNPKRYRLTVPEQDESVQRWLSEQLNMSVSIRHLIREDIERNGYSDVTCRSVEQGAKRGRPSNAELARREQEAVQKAACTETMQDVQKSEQQNLQAEQPASQSPVQTFVQPTQQVQETPAMDPLLQR